MEVTYPAQTILCFFEEVHVHLFESPGHPMNLGKKFHKPYFNVLRALIIQHNKDHNLNKAEPLQDQLYGFYNRAKNHEKPQVSIRTANQEVLDTLAQMIGHASFRDAVTYFNLPQQIDDSGENEKTKAQNPISGYEGIYLGFVIVPQNYCIIQLAMWLQPDGTTIIKTRLDRPQVYQGHFQYDEQARLLIGSFKSTARLTPLGYYNFNFVIQATRTRDEKDRFCYTGVYSGKGVRDDVPMGGRIILYPQHVKEDCAQAFSTIQPQIFRFGVPELRALRHEYPDLIRFFVGRQDNFIESTAFFERVHILPAHHRIDDVRNMAGTYYLYRLKGNRKAIVKQPLSIDPDGNVQVRVSDQNEKHVEPHYILGQARYQSNLLSIQFFGYKRGTKSGKNFAQILLYSSRVGASDIKHHILGTYAAVNRHDRATCGRLVLVKANFEFESAAREDILLFSAAYHQLDAEHQHLASFLTGDANNLILSFKEVDHALERHEDYGSTYFDSACQQIRRKGNPETARIQCKYRLRNAFDHGFQDWKLFEEERQQGTFDLLQQADWAYLGEQCPWLDDAPITLSPRSA